MTMVEGSPLSEPEKSKEKSAQAAEILDTINRILDKAPMLRVGQVIMNCMNHTDSFLYFEEDIDMLRKLRTYEREHVKEK